jgi:DnaJ-class molecular chaperone
MKDVIEWFREQEGWKLTKCFVCYGTGQVSDYSGGYFNGPKECDMCAGSGQHWITPKGRYVRYPGGPFC